MEQFGFHPIIHQWFESKYTTATAPQQQGWPHILAGQHTLIAAPTGSGKTLAAFLACIDRIFRCAVDDQLEPGVRVVYVSPLRALSNDMQRNLQQPLSEIQHLAEQQGLDASQIRIGLRTGDTTPSQRQSLVRKPPHILVTTPESLYLLLTGPRSRDILRTVDTLIVDEIHALIRDKRGSHLALSMERLAALTGKTQQRIGLSATQKPIADVARFLIGKQPDTCQQATEGRPHCTAGQPMTCQVVDVGHSRKLDLGIETPTTALESVCSHEQWAEVYERLVQLIRTHRSTLIFVNTRRMAERLAHQLAEKLGDEEIAAHHGSLSRNRRLVVLFTFTQYVPTLFTSNTSSNYLCI
ncbi:MAG: DEAD/DEAH box helicase, partial [Planctomycetaceae bacterium]